MTNKRKTTTAIVAGVTAVALVIGGTFAWTSISQQAQNEAAGIVNVVGRLHDDFNGTNKDVYVENFTDPLNGGQPIYARVMLTEYMEVGQDAGGFGIDVNTDGRVVAVPVVDGTDINNTSTWTPHIPVETCEECATEGTCVIHEHWSWTMGGQTTFMPTFNKDKDSLKADINGTYQGTVGSDNIYYDNYVTYTTDHTGAIFTEGTDTLPFADAIYQKTGTAYYDDDTDTEDNDGTRQVEETHTAKQTAEGTVITMDTWKNTYSSAAGDYWVYDTNTGWAYWANPIMPGEATGLLLNGIGMTKNPGEKCYYAINVVGQFSTINDWDKFYTSDSGDPDISEDGRAVLEAASKNVPVVTVTNTNGSTLLPGNESAYPFSASVVINGETVAEQGTFTWSVLNDNLEEITNGTTIDENGNLTVAANEKSKTLTIIAKSDKYLGAVGVTSVNVAVTELPEMKIIATPNIPSQSLEPGRSYTLSLTEDGTTVEGVTYELSLVDTSATNPDHDDGKLSSDTKIEGVTLSIASDETGEGYDTDNYNIVQVVAKDADGNELATRRFLINMSGLRTEGIVFVNEEGNGTQQNVNVPSTLGVGQVYTWYVPIQCSSSNMYLNEWLTLSDVDIEVSEFSVYTYDDSSYDYIADPDNKYLTISSDLSTVTVNKEYAGTTDEYGNVSTNLYVKARGNENVEDDYSWYAFETTQPVIAVDFGALTITAYEDDEEITATKSDDDPYYQRLYVVDNAEYESVTVEFNRFVYFGDSTNLAKLNEMGVVASVVENKLYVTFSGKDFTTIAGDTYVARITLNTAKVGDEIIIDFTAGKTVNS